MFNSKLAFSVIVLLLLCPNATVLADAPAPTLEFRLAEDTESPGWQKLALPGSDQPIFVAAEASLNGSHIERVSFYKDRSGNPSIGLVLTDDGAKVMEATTSRNLNKKLAIVLDGKVLIAPTIRTTITKEVEITGLFGEEDLLKLFRAIVLRDLK
ncbi:MAG: hypothetical protein U0795_24950 [Pirellulales bacterium]